TGAFTVESHQPGVKTVYKANPNWWQKPQHNIKEIIFTPIGSDATRVAALLSGEVDIIEPVPTQDIARVDSSPNAKVLKGPEIRTIFLGMDQVRDELLYSNVKGKNPFKDVRVREAFCQAVVGMLARIGVKINLLAQPKAQYFAKVLKPGGYQTSFYLLGWTPGTSDSHDVLNNIMGCRDDPKSNRGEANLSGYCNKQID